MVWSRAWPTCSEPVTFGGGMTMENGRCRCRVGREVAAVYPQLVPPLLYLARRVLGGQVGVDRLGASAPPVDGLRSTPSS